MANKSGNQHKSDLVVILFFHKVFSALFGTNVQFINMFTIL
jgi:hypothetical protein